MKENTREISLFKRRILEYAESVGISKYEIYQNTGISNGVFSQKGGLSEDNILRFLSYYKDISSDWLLTGAGNMFKSEEKAMGNIGVVPHAPQQTDLKSLADLIQNLTRQNADLATQLGMQIKENEQLHQKNMELLAENERQKKLSATPPVQWIIIQVLPNR